MARATARASWAPRRAAKILSVRVTLDSGDPLLANPAMTSRLPVSIADGIRYATKNGASVIDLPLDPGAAGASGTPGVPGLAVSSPAEQSAVAYALRKGVVLVAPAGDDGAGTGIVNYPAAYPGVISVGAFDQNLAKAPFSSRKSYVTLTAAGEGVTAEAPAGYATISSTSAASAIVTGIVAIIRSEFPALTPRQVTKALTSGTQFQRPGGRLIGSGFGTADAAKALRAATAMAEPRGQRARRRRRRAGGSGDPGRPRDQAGPGAQAAPGWRHLAGGTAGPAAADHGIRARPAAPAAPGGIGIRFRFRVARRAGHHAVRHGRDRCRGTGGVPAVAAPASAPAAGMPPARQPGRPGRRRRGARSGRVRRGG